MPKTSQYETIQLDIAGSSNQNTSEPVSIQKTLNFYPEVTDPGGINKTVLHSWASHSLKFLPLSQARQSEAVRGMASFRGALYRVLGLKLYKYTENPDPLAPVQSKLLEQEIGDVPGSGECGFANNGDTLVVTNGATPLSWDDTTFSILTGIAFNPKTVQFLNDRFIFDGDDGKFYMSDVQSTNVDVANSAFPRSSSDAFVMPIVYNQVIYMMGTKTIEPWEPAASGLPPANRINQGIIEGIGVDSPFGVAVTPDAFFFISSKGIAYKVVSFQAQEISFAGITSELSQLDLTCVSATTVNRYGQQFVIFSFRNDEVTWVYSDTTGAWFQLSSNTNDLTDLYKQGRYDGVSFVDIFGETYVGIYYNASIAVLSNDAPLTFPFTTYERILPVLAGDTFGKGGNLYEISKVSISMEAGVGTGIISSTDNSNNPVLMVSFSTDGKNFGTEEWISLGETGDNPLIEVYKLIQYRRLYIKLKITDRGKYSLYDVSVDIRQAGY